jgi:AcrR family transcriptional regulator
MPTAKGEETRRRIVWAAWELTSRCGAEQLLGGLSLRDVAAEAGMSPSALTYHFPTMRDLAMGMVDELVQSHGPQAQESVEAPFVGVEAKSMAETVSEAAAANWAVITTPDEVEFERRFARCLAATGSEADGNEVALRLAGFHRSWVEEMSAIYEDAAASASLRLVDPFTFQELAAILTAVFEGLQRHWMSDSRLVRDRLVAEAAVAIASVMLVPSGQVVALGEVSAGLPRGDLDPGAEELDPGVAAAVGVAGLFSGGVEGVTLTEVAEALEWHPDEVLARLGPVRRVAALCFARHVGGIEAAASRRRDADPALALGDALFELARCVKGDRWCALALLFERLETRAGVVSDPTREAMSQSVPLTRMFRALLEELDDGSVGGGSLGVGDSAELMVDTVLSCGASPTSLALSSVVEAALRIGAPRSPGQPAARG